MGNFQVQERLVSVLVFGESVMVLGRIRDALLRGSNGNFMSPGIRSDIGGKYINRSVSMILSGERLIPNLSLTGNISNLKNNLKSSGESEFRDLV